MNREKISKSKYDIGERAIVFAVNCRKMTDNLPICQKFKEYGKQLIRSSSSIGANIEEADGTLSKRDFVNKMAIARREARESRYWLKLIKACGMGNKEDIDNGIDPLIQESYELMLILSSIVNKVRTSYKA